ncbi:MAG TPA: OmcA/MtrC family decaheme c-type cytochrome [Kofleriaceae bacterium]|nr:OmcA/MtrC family decaheme c-type cytochrome [Kofleriaceae bacterium]
MRLSRLLLILAACGDSSGGGRDAGTVPTGTAGPGVDIAVAGLTFDKTGAHVEFTVADPQGVPLDLGASKVGVSFILAQLATNPDGSPGQYTAYTTRTATKQFPAPDASVSATQATNESVSAGKLETVDAGRGSYRYTFAAPVTDMDPGLTQTVLALAVRDMGDGGEAIDRDLFSIVPAGGDPLVREEVTDQTCNSCHGTLAAHGGRYTSPRQCVLCHTPQTSDPDTGNTVDFRAMIHKIHAGEELASHQVDPSVHYTIVGFMNSVHDFSSVALPGPAEDGTNVARCETCHAGAQGDVWRTRPTKDACTSCHDTTIFTAPGNPPRAVPHQGGVDPALVNDSTCVICHAATSGIAPITQVHYRGVFSPTLPKVELALLSIANTGPGMLPTITFQATVDGAPRNLIAQPLTNLTATLAGPTTDIASYWQARIQGTGAVGTLTAVDAGAGVFSYAFPAAGCTDALSSNRPCVIPATATGSYEVGLEGYLQPTAADPRAAAFSPVLAFAVTDPAPVPRRMIVSSENCNGCHLDLSAHGGSRKNPSYCVFCHNPNKANDTRAPHPETGTVLAQSVDFRVMIHKIHMGDELTQPYVLGSFPAPSAANPAGTPINFGETRYPRPRTDCGACHIGKTWMLPMASSPAYLPSTALQLTCNEPPQADPDNFCAPANFVVTQTIKLQPQASVCTSCHDSPSTAAHAEVNTTTSGAESCATCHGAGMAWDVSKFHGSP